MKKIFDLKGKGTTVYTEFVAGVTTFMAMAYILLVNPGFFSQLDGVSFGASYVATALSAVIGTLLVGLLSNLPLAQASGLGLSAFFVFTVCFGFGFTYANALVFVLVDGIIFVVLTVTGLRRLFFDAIPDCVKKIIPAGIGLFIAFLGFQDAGIIVSDRSTLVTLASFNLLGRATWATVMPMLVTIVTLFTIAILSKKGVTGAIVYSILGGTALYYLLGLSVPDFYANFVFSVSLNPLDVFRDFFDLSFGRIFLSGFDFSVYLAAHTVPELLVTFITTALAFCMVDMFDTMGTLYGACKTGNLLLPDENGEYTVVPRMNRSMLADAISTCVGAVCGTSTVTTYVESSAGAGVGGKTGLSSVFTALLFFLSLFLTPLAALIPASAYAAALIYIGVLMIGCTKDVLWDDPSVALPSFLTLAVMAFTFTVSYGIAFGLLSYCVIQLFCGKAKTVKPMTWIVTALFAAMFFFTH